MEQEHEDNNVDRPSYDWATKTHSNTQLNEKGNVQFEKSLSQFSQKSISSRSSKQSHSDSHHTASNNSKAELNKMDITSHSIATELFGKQPIATKLIDPQFIAKLEFLCDIVPIPVEVIKLLTTAGLNSPHKIINQFGGNIGGFARQLCYMQPSIFLHKHHILTKRLFRLSRLLLDIPYI